jgi:NodT family efflux transporter outer membrane factor (OMF) lipoprotein
MSKSIRPPLLAAVAPAAMLCGCATVGPDFASPEAPAPASYAMAGDAAPAGVSMTPEARVGGAWWTAFGSPALDRTVRDALAASPDVAQAAATLQRAQAQLAAVRGEEGLQADLTAGATRERINLQAFGFSGFPGLPPLANPTISLFSVGGAVSYDLDLFGGQKRAREAATARVEAEARRADAAYLALSGNVALQAARIAGLQAQLDTVDAIVAADREQIRMVREAERAGGAATSATTVGEAQLAQDEALAPPLRQAMAAARHQLALLVGKAPGEWTAPDFRLADFTTPATVPVSLPSQLVHDRPDIQAAEADLHAATAQIGVATASLYPDISLNAGLTQSALKPEDIFQYNASGWTFGPSLRLPLFDRTGKARRAEALANAQLSSARYQATVLRAFVEVADGLSALAHDQENLAVLDRAEDLGQSAVADARKAYDLGGGALLPVVDASRRLAQVRRQKAELQGQVLTDLVQLYTATGAGWREPAAG